MPRISVRPILLALALVGCNQVPTIPSAPTIPTTPPQDSIPSGTYRISRNYAVVWNIQVVDAAADGRQVTIEIAEWPGVRYTAKWVFGGFSGYMFTSHEGSQYGWTLVFKNTRCEWLRETVTDYGMVMYWQDGTPCTIMQL